VDWSPLTKAFAQAQILEEVTDVYDAIVIGARCAGSPTAMLLARRGYRVLLLDRARFPSDIPHGHMIHKTGPRRLKQWGLLDRVVASGCPPVSTMTTDFGDSPLVARGLVVDGLPFGYAPRRKVLDQILVDAAVEAGAEVRDGFAVEEFVREGDRIVGIRGRDTRQGSVVTEQARITIGADGRNSRLARAVGAPTYEDTPSLTCAYYTYWSDVPCEGLEHHQRESRAVVLFPTNDGLTQVLVGWPVTEFPRVRSDVDGSFWDSVSLFPDLAERLQGGKRVEPYYGTADLPNFFRKPFGPGWALVGDAGCHKNPYLALGISDAFRDAELLAEALDDGLSGKRQMDEALADYESRRNKATLPDYHEDLQAARLGALPPEAVQLRAALRRSPEDATRFVMAQDGMVPREQFFNPENLQRIMSEAAIAARRSQAA
jgi:flavin-dependent dehydrogenase